MSKARRLVKFYLVPAKTSDYDFEYELDKAMQRVANGDWVRWNSTPSVEAEKAFKNICRRHGIQIED